MKYLAVLLVLAVFVPALRAQSNSDSTWKDIKLGPMFEAGGSVNAGNVANGAKTNFGFAWNADAAAVFPLAPRIAIDAVLGYDSRSISFYKQDDQNFKYDYNFNYFAIRPGLLIGAFSVGLGLGIPLGYSVTVQQGANQPTTSSSIGATAMNLLLEVRLGAMVPLIESPNGDLNFLVEGTYSFNNLVSNGPLPYYDPKAGASSSSNNGPLATLQFGFSYLFDLNPR